MYSFHSMLEFEKNIDLYESDFYLYLLYMPYKRNVNRKLFKDIYFSGLLRENEI